MNKLSIPPSNKRFHKVEYEFEPNEDYYKREFGPDWYEAMQQNYESDFIAETDCMVSDTAPLIENFNSTLTFHKLVGDDYAYDMGSYIYVVDLSEYPWAEMDEHSVMHELDRLWGYTHDQDGYEDPYGNTKYHRRLIKAYFDEVDRINDFLEDLPWFHVVHRADIPYPNTAQTFFASANRKMKMKKPVRKSTKSAPRRIWR